MTQINITKVFFLTRVLPFTSHIHHIRPTSRTYLLSSSSPPLPPLNSSSSRRRLAMSSSSSLYFVLRYSSPSPHFIREIPPPTWFHHQDLRLITFWNSWWGLVVPSTGARGSGGGKSLVSKIDHGDFWKSLLQKSFGFEFLVGEKRERRRCQGGAGSGRKTGSRQIVLGSRRKRKWGW